MPTTFANTIDGNDIYAARAVADKDGNQIDTTYAKASTLATVATTGDYDDLSNKPTIPAALSAGNGIDITSNVVSAKLDGASLTNGANGLSVTLPVPSTSGATQGDVLTIGANGLEWDAASTGTDVFFATYGTTTWNEIETAHDAGKLVFLYKASPNGYLLPMKSIFISNVDSESNIKFDGVFYADSYTGIGSLSRYELNKVNGWSIKAQSTIKYPTSSDVGKVYRAFATNRAQWESINELPASTSADATKVLTVDSNGDAVWMSPSYGLFEAVYGTTSYSDIVDAINAHKIVYCRIAATGASRMAFLAYIGTSNVEFQYYRSLSSHSAANQTDEVYVYKVSASGWTTETRLTGIKYEAGTHMTSSFANNTLTFQSVWPTVDQTFDGTSTNAQSGTAVAGALATKEDSFTVGTGLEMDTTGGTNTLQVEAPVDIVAGPGITIDNPDGNTLRISQSYPSDETVLYDDTATYTYGRSSVVLSESIKNFELIKIYTSKGSVATYWPHNPQNVTTCWLEFNGAAWHWTVEWAFTSNTLYEGSSGLMWKPAETSTISVSPGSPYNRWLQPVKIIGIHRIANN